MKLPVFVPTPAAIAREALIVLGGALVAAFVMSQLPAVKAYVKKAWA